MFARIKIQGENDLTYYKPINVFNIASLDFVNLRNVDEGTIVQTRTGETYLSPEPLDILDVRIQDVYERYAVLIVVQAAGELGKLMKKPVKKPTKKPVTTRKRS